jgi:hypothetical protein
VPKLRVCALRFTDTARARIVKVRSGSVGAAGKGEGVWDQLASAYCTLEQQQQPLLSKDSGACSRELAGCRQQQDRPRSWIWCVAAAAGALESHRFSKSVKAVAQHGGSSNRSWKQWCARRGHSLVYLQLRMQHCCGEPPCTPAGARSGAGCSCKLTQQQCAGSQAEPRVLHGTIQQMLLMPISCACHQQL